jgi:nitrilase
MYAHGEDGHVSVWPGDPGDTVDIARFIALEGRVSLAASGLISLDDVPADLPLREELEAAEVRDYCRAGDPPAGTPSPPLDVVLSCLVRQP